eukprot:4124863-Prorocentrum_lima.AAC.1
MTSSLVGSEMCIRDRKGIIHTMKQQLNTFKLPSSLKKEITAQHDKQEVCLLYTSDAADDM